MQVPHAARIRKFKSCRRLNVTKNRNRGIDDMNGKLGTRTSALP
ncbi:hypothetical protein AG1IA_00689 [Rhizoctonia solani AG-1 IA]|uniref:Uncharacterized protein n=1 Tax=Thanatephorus cucumeris (strain AG1-IA) TaxID=983506 RepID=L8X883_THACA|nr:hypothetical protein AG1IA_00689 [Rhizoctonia solani AG-1 IA]